VADPAQQIDRKPGLTRPSWPNRTRNDRGDPIATADPMTLPRDYSPSSPTAVVLRKRWYICANAMPGGGAPLPIGDAYAMRTAADLDI